MNEEGRRLVEAMKHETVSPHHDSPYDGTVGASEYDLGDQLVVRAHQDVEDGSDMDGVAVVDEKEVELQLLVPGM